MHSMRHVALSVVVLFALLFAALTVSPLGFAQVPLQFVPVTPCRVADTRLAPGPFGGPALQGQTSRDFAIPESACSIPSTAAAYSLNVAVVPHGGLGYLTVWPAGQPRPVIATLNSVDGRIKANAAIIPAGTNEAISVYATQTTDVILDIDGYFVPATSATLAFFPLTPCRVADTRWTIGPLGGPYLAGGQERIFPVLSSTCNIPDTALAYSLNFAAIPHGPLGYMTVWPTGQNKPLVSTLNALTGTVTANAALVPSGLQGAISVYPSSATDLVIDVDGYFAQPLSGPQPADGPQPLSLYTLAPCRVLDTRHGSGAFSGTIAVDVLTSVCQVPSAQAYVLNATVVPYHGQPLGYLTLWPDAESKPVVATLNALDGAITSNMAIVPTLNGSIDAFATTPTDLVADIFSYFAPISPLNITTTSLPSATLNFQYSATLGASGGVPPYTWNVTVGSLPPGLNLDPASGLISGTPTVTGTYPFTVQVADSQSPPATASAPLSITVNATLTQLTVVTTSLPAGTQNTAYNAMLAATGGVTPYTWSVIAGSLPVGLHLNVSTGAITGTPSGAGISNFTVQVTDFQLSTATAPLSITIAPAVVLSITTTSLPSGNAGTAYSATVVAIGGVYPYSWSITSGTLPPGLGLNPSTGAISGTPTTVGTSNFTVKVTDSETPPVTASAPLSIVINPGGGGNPGALTGNYAFFLNGFNSSGAWTLAGSFISDGHGNITSGVVDGNSVAGQPFNTTVSGTYWIAANGVNTITIQGQSFGPVTFAFVLNSSANGRIIRYDDTTGQGSRGSGVLRKANSSAFSLSALNGGWVYGSTGVDSSGQYYRQVLAGQMSLANGSISNGTGDVNDGGTYSTFTFSGNLSSIDAQTGRGVVTIQSTYGTSHTAVYVVSASELVMEGIDSQNGLSAGSVLKQSGPFNNGSLNGLTVAYYQAVDGADESGASIIHFDGNGNSNFLAEDDDNAGVITQKTPSQGTYTVAANGAVSTSGGGPVGFLISQNKAFLVGTGNSPAFDWIEPQTGGPFSNASIAGTYAGGSLPPLDYANAHNELNVGPADGLGTLTLNGDSSGAGGLDQWFNYIINYSIASNGRGTAPGNPSGSEGVFYVISPTKWIVLMPKTDARMDVFTH